MHYSIGTNSKSMATPKKKASSSLNSLQSSNILLSQIKSVEAGNEVVKPKKDYLQLVKARTSPGKWVWHFLSQFSEVLHDGEQI